MLTNEQLAIVLQLYDTAMFTALMVVGAFVFLWHVEPKLQNGLTWIAAITLIALIALGLVLLY